MSLQNVPTLLAQHFQALAKQLQHFSATYPYIVGRNMLCVFGHPIVMCCNMLGIESRISAHAQVQHCCTNRLGAQDILWGHT